MTLEISFQYFPTHSAMKRHEMRKMFFQIYIYIYVKYDSHN